MRSRRRPLVPSCGQNCALQSVVHRDLGWRIPHGHSRSVRNSSASSGSRSMPKVAVAQRVAPKATTDRRLEMRLRDNDRALRTAYHATVAAVREERTITPAADWLVDNFHVVEEQVREIRIDLPPGFHRQLPKLMGGPFEGYPRVFGLAWAFVAHTDSRFDPEMLCRFVRAYQRVQPFDHRRALGGRDHAAGRARGEFAAFGRRHRGLPSSAGRGQPLADRLLGIGSREAEPADAILRGLEGHCQRPSRFSWSNGCVNKTRE